MKALAPHWGALIALALFLVVGLAVLDDYGVAWDEFENRVRATTAWAFLAGNEDAFFDAPFYVQLYGPPFELTLLFAERALGIDHARGVHLSNHLILHCFFLAGGLFAYLLARRLSGDGRIALFAMAIFLLHPRIYAHSFFNSKDIAFLAMFMIALFLAHRAFRRDTLLAFALLGAAVGVLVNLRMMGMVLLAAILALRALDPAFAQGMAERKRVILTTGAFALTAALTVYALLPYLWADPVERAVEWWSVLSDHPTRIHEMFQGARVRSVNFPEYIPVWFSIASPPFALFLGLVGATAVLVGAVRAPQVAVRRGSLRFGLLLIGCVAVPVATVILLDANIYNAWRQMYFLWAPFSLLAVVGLRRLAAAFPQARSRAMVYGAAGAGVAATLISMALIHPNEQVYFNALVDRVTPERLRTQYEMDYWRHPVRQALEWIADNPSLIPNNPGVAQQPARRMTAKNLEILPEETRARIPENLRVAIVPVQAGRAWSRSKFALGRVQVYDNTLLLIGEPTADLQAAYEEARGRKPDIDAAFDVTRLDGSLVYVKERCKQADEEARFFLHIVPERLGDLPEARRELGFDNLDFLFFVEGARFDGKCVAWVELPEYAIASFRTGQFGSAGEIWSAEFEVQ